MKKTRRRDKKGANMQAEQLTPPTRERNEVKVPLDDDTRGEKGFAINYGWAVIARFNGEELWGWVAIEDDVLATFLHAAAASRLPPLTRYELRERIPFNFGRSRGTGWFHCPSMAKKEKWGIKSQTSPPEGGYTLLGQFTTPAEARE
jgi:hypothetical protein